MTSRLILKMGVIDIHCDMAISTQNSGNWTSTSLLYTDLELPKDVIRPTVLLFVTGPDPLEFVTGIMYIVLVLLCCGL